MARTVDWSFLEERVGEVYDDDPSGSHLSVRGREPLADRCQAKFCTLALGRQADRAHRRKQAKIAVARKMAVFLHSVWTSGTEFQARCALHEATLSQHRSAL